MRHVCAFLFCLVVSGPSFCQEYRADLFAGYSYLNIDTNGLSSRQNANGWEVGVSGNFNKWFAVEGDVSGYYKDYSINLVDLGLGTLNVKVTDYSLAAGPRINLRPIFIHALFGSDHLTASAMGFSESQDGFAGLAGGGAQWKVSGPWSVRASVDDVFTRHNIFGGSAVTQNNYRASIGVVYSFGAKHASRIPAEETHPSSAPVNTKPTQPRPEGAESRVMQPPAPKRAETGMRIPALEVIVTLGRVQGSEVTDEAPNGVAALAGIHPGDVINAVDGKLVGTPMELAAELSSRAAGDKVRFGYLLHGLWQSETVILLGANR